MKKGKLIILIIITLILSHPMVAFSKDNAFTLKFNKGKISTTVSNSIIRGDRDTYYFHSNPGQHISIAVTSLENNAVFELLYKKNEAWVAVEGTQEGEDARTWYGKLPESESNRYGIKVGGTRGNASYELFIGISVVDY